MGDYSINVFELKSALRQIDAAGIEVGDRVCVTWKIDGAYGGGTRSHTGVLAFLDRKTGRFEVKASNQSPGHLRSSITSIHSTITKLDDEEDIVENSSKPNPFIKKAKKNPFLEKAGK